MASRPALMTLQISGYERRTPLLMLFVVEYS
jgi:hypothetical protein